MLNNLDIEWVVGFVFCWCFRLMRFRNVICFRCVEVVLFGKCEMVIKCNNLLRF